MNPVAAPTENPFDLDIELLDEAAENSGSDRVTCSGCRPRSLRGLDLD